MRAVIQRVCAAVVSIDGLTKSQIGPGLLVLLGVANGDTADDVAWLAGKIAALRIFSDDAGRMNRSVCDVNGEVMIISQFTLIASTRKGTRPSFNDAARPELAVPLYESFVQTISKITGKPAATGKFGAEMKVTLTNDGPVTLVIDSRHRE
ncbi:MAG: D-aminoacyl-tRNA deacylase [Opitutaceae bacterium]